MPSILSIFRRPLLAHPQIRELRFFRGQHEWMGSVSVPALAENLSVIIAAGKEGPSHSQYEQVLGFRDWWVDLEGECREEAFELYEQWHYQSSNGCDANLSMNEVWEAIEPHCLEVVSDFYPSFPGLKVNLRMTLPWDPEHELHFRIGDDGLLDTATE